MITYGDRITPVQLGDRVRTRIWLRKHEGRVEYVPGISPLNAVMEFNGMRWVGVRLAEGGFMSVAVDPEHEFLHGKLTFVARDTTSVVELRPDQDPHGEDSFGAPF